MMKFRQGLNSDTQDYIACLTNGCPLDKLLREWYAAVRLVDENCIANEAFRNALCMASCGKTMSLGMSMFRRITVRTMVPLTPTSCYTPPSSTPMNPTVPPTTTNPKPAGIAAPTCY
jgi:hypothetical protein